jgi:hypothetical protein
MRLKINLATQPYEDARHFLVVWTGAIGVLVLLAVVLSYAVVTRWHQYKIMSGNLAREQQILDDLAAKQRQDLALLNKPENYDVRQRSEYLNELILRKEISWTKIFTDLEKMMPPHLRVLAIQPKVDGDQILISMMLGGGPDSRDRAAELVRRMEHSRTFRAAYITKENDGTAGPAASSLGPQSDSMRFQLTAEYVPGEETTPAPAATAQNAPSAGGGQ